MLLVSLYSLSLQPPIRAVMVALLTQHIAAFSHCILIKWFDLIFLQLIQHFGWVLFSAASSASHTFVTHARRTAAEKASSNRHMTTRAWMKLKGAHAHSSKISPCFHCGAVVWCDAVLFVVTVCARQRYDAWNVLSHNYFDWMTWCLALHLRLRHINIPVDAEAFIDCVSRLLGLWLFHNACIYQFLSSPRAANHKKRPSSVERTVNVV